MASFTIRSAASSGIYAKLVLTEQSQSVANNTTTLLWQLYMWNTQAKPEWYAYEEHNIVQILINGQYVLNTDDFGMISLQYEQTESSAKLITSGTTTIAHDSNGSKSIKASFYVEQGWYGAYKWSGPETTISLTTIARASKPTLSVSSLTFGNSVTIYTNRASDSFTHTLTYSIGSTSGTIGTAKGVTTSEPWTPDKSLAAQFPNDPSGRVSITCTTYNGSTQIGDPVTIYLALNLSSDMVPTISGVTFEDVGQSIFSHSSVGGYVQSKSKLEYTVNASGNNGSTISSYQVKINGSTYYSKTDTTGYLSTVGTNTVTVTVVDSRGQTATRNDIYFTVVEYVPPRISSLKAYRCDGSGNYDEDGSNMYVIFTGTIAALSGNTRNVVLKTGPAGEALTARSITFSGTTYSFTGTLLIAAEASKSYNVEVTIADKYGLWSVPYTTSISTASILMNIRPNKDGIAFGKMAEKAKTVQLGWDLELKGDPTEDNHAANKKYVDTKQTLCKATIDLTGYNENIWYPVTTVIDNMGMRKLNAYSKLYDGDIPSWSTHGSGFYANLVMLVQAYGWGQTSGDEICLEHDYRHANSNPIGYMQMGNSSSAVLYLRGGGIYYIETDWNCTWSIKTSDYTVSSQTAALKTEPPGVTLITVGTIQGNLNGNATSATTASEAYSIEPTYIAKGTTVGDLKTALKNWASSYASRPNACAYFYSAVSFVSKWNAGDDTLTLDAGTRWDVRIINAAYPYVLLEIGSYDYSTGHLYNVVLYNGVWQKVKQYLSYESQALAKDYVVAQGTSNNWTYVKYESGIAMCWKATTNVSSTFSTTWGNWYCHDGLFPAETYPFTFTDLPKVFATQRMVDGSAYVVGDWFLYTYGNGTTTKSPGFSAARPTKPSAAITLCINLLAIGRWK